MPKKPVQDPKETAKAREAEKTEKTTETKTSTSFLKVDRSLRPSGYHCDELNNGTYDAYDPKE